MTPTIEVSCRVDFRPAGTQEFTEWTGRIDRLSATGCTIQSTPTPEPGAHLELRIYLPGNAWPTPIQQAEVVWNHWGEFTVEFLGVSMHAEDELRRCLTEASVLTAA